MAKLASKLLVGNKGFDGTIHFLAKFDWTQIQPLLSLAFSLQTQRSKSSPCFTLPPDNFVNMNAKSYHFKDLTHLRNTLISINGNGFRPTLAIVFSSKKFDLNELSGIFKEQNIQMLGCSTAGEIVDTELHEGAIAAILMDMKPEHFKIHFTEYEEGQVYQAAFSAGAYAKTCFENPGLIIMSGGMTVDAEKLIAGMKDGIGKEVPMYGGLAGDDVEMVKTFAFTHEQVTKCGISTLILDNDKIQIKGMATSGWEALGGVNTITKAEGNLLYTINDEPAYDVFIRYFGISEESASKREQLISIQTNYPLQIIREGGYSVLRSPLQLDEDKRTIMLAASVEEGSRFRFSSSPGFEVIEQTVEEFGQLKQNVTEADATILFSCKGRHGAFGPVLEEEIEGIYNYWKAPLIGFLSYGEIGNMGSGTCEFHNETCSLVLLKEM